MLVTHLAKIKILIAIGKLTDLVLIGVASGDVMTRTSMLVAPSTAATSTAELFPIWLTQVVAGGT